MINRTTKPQACENQCHHLTTDAEDCNAGTIAAVWWEEGRSDERPRLVCRECLDACSQDLGYVRLEDYAPHAVLELAEHYGQNGITVRVLAIYPTEASARACRNDLNDRPHELAHNQAAGWVDVVPVVERDANYQGWLDGLDWDGCPSPDGSDYAANAAWAEQRALRVGGLLPVSYEGELVLVDMRSAAPRVRADQIEISVRDLGEETDYTVKAWMLPGGVILADCNDGSYLANGIDEVIHGDDQADSFELTGKTAKFEIEEIREAAERTDYFGVTDGQRLLARVEDVLTHTQTER